MADFFKMEDLINTDFDLSSQFHVLKHFTVISKEYRDQILNNLDYSPGEIDERLKRSVSKFHPDFVSDPLNLYQILIKEISVNNTVINWVNNRCDLQLIYPKEQYPAGIGDDRTVKVADLTDKERRSIRFEDRNGEKIRIARGKSKSTWKVNIILYKIQDKMEILSIFPGEYAPPLPDKENQTGEEYLNSKNFWKDHVFLKINENLTGRS